MSERRTVSSEHHSNGPHSYAGSGDRIFATGEMADLVRAFDWSATPIGPIEQWPTTLLVTVNNLLSSRHPMFLWWGDELIQFYNDAYRPSLGRGKHPKALGQAGRDCWIEIWHIIGPQIDGVMSRGEATWHENQLVPIFRRGRQTLGRRVLDLRPVVLCVTRTGLSVGRSLFVPKTLDGCWPSNNCGSARNDTRRFSNWRPMPSLSPM